MLSKLQNFCYKDAGDPTIVKQLCFTELTCQHLSQRMTLSCSVSACINPAAAVMQSVVWSSRYENSNDFVGCRGIIPASLSYQIQKGATNGPVV